MKKLLLAGMLAATTAGAAMAAPVTYNLDPGHTYPSFEADHMGGLSTWRGKFNKNSGKVVLDREAGTGTVEVEIDVDSIDFGHDKMNEHAKKGEMFDVANHPTATYKGKFVDFRDGAPTAVEGELTLRGVTRPVRLTINHFLCKEHPMLKREVCGVDAEGSFQRDEFGVDYGKQMGFLMDVRILIQAEAIRAD
jgi:polyisoprenoid-binding protein YceI